jgi:hypothetical protein
MQTVHRARGRATAVAFLLLIASAAHPAGVIIPSLELITHVGPAAGAVELQTYGNISLSIEGGYKFGGNVALGLSHEQSLENVGATSGLSLDFLSASMTIRSLFSLPVNVEYFVGGNDVLCSGEGFIQFGVAPIMTAYRGYLSFPTGPMYDGIYEVWGTGVHVQYTPKAETASLDLYVYEDTHPAWPGGANPLFSSLGTWSGDLRFLLNFSALKLEAFAGATLSPAAAPSGLYRGGLLFYAADRNVEFLAQVGVPLWDPVSDPGFSVELFYLLVEPRLHLGSFSIVPTFFWHPAGYMQALNPTEKGSFDVNLNMFLGDATRTTLQGGVQSNVRFHSPGQFEARVSPWVGFTTPGVVWTVKLTTNLFPFDLANLLEGFVGVQAEF